MDENKSLLRQLVSVLSAGTYVFGGWDVIQYNYGSTLFSNGGKLLERRVGGSSKAVARMASTVLGVVASILQRSELTVLRARRIPYFVLYQGSDARQGDYSREHFAVSIAAQDPPGYYAPESDAWKRRQIALMGKHAAGIYALNPDLLHVLPDSARFVPYHHVAVQDWEPLYTQADHPRLVFAHAPSNRRVKGTDLILSALAELRADGHDFELDLIEGVSNAEALERYGRADVVIDQLFAGWYGGVAVEAMALGKPVVVYIRDEDLGFLPAGMAADLPFFRATPEGVKETLRQVLEMPRAELVERGRQSRGFVERWHDPVAITSRILDDYRRAGASSTAEGDGAP